MRIIMKNCKICLEDLIPFYDGIGDKTDFVCHNPYCEKYWVYQKNSSKYILNQAWQNS